MKYSDHKTKWHMVPFEALDGVARVMWAGLKKGTPQERTKDDWKKGTDYSQYFDALTRHAFAWWSGEDRDQDTKENHLYHVICCAMILVWYQIKGVGRDDRPTN